MDNKIVQSLWIGKTLSMIEYLCIKSFIDNGHQFLLYSYDKDISGYPEGTIVKDASEIIPSDQVYKDVANTYTSFANWFRYKLLYSKGGWWVDMDVICLKEFDFKDDYCFTTEVCFDFGIPRIIANNAIIKSPPKAEFLHDMIEYMEKVDLPKASWGSFGSRFLEKVLKNYESDKYIQPPHVFCLINWHQVDLFFKDNLEFPFDHCHAVHLWNNIWSKKGIDKNGKYGATSIIEKLKLKYLISS